MHTPWVALDKDNIAFQYFPDQIDNNISIPTSVHTILKRNHLKLAH